MYCPECGAYNRDTATFCMNCGKKLPEFGIVKSEGNTGKLHKKKKNHELEPGSLLDGRYRIVAKLASGGMGRLYLADDTRMNFPVVIKQMLIVADSDKKLKYLEKRFIAEAQLLFRLKHRSLPRVVDYFNKDSSSYMIMEYVKGENFSQLLGNAQDNRISIEDCYQLMLKTLDILIYLHNQHPPVIHRDIKPGNLMLNPEGEVLLVDFGLARHLPPGKKGTARVGTYGFSSPEHQTGKFGTESDLYSFGATFHYLLSGENPRNRLPFNFPPLSDYRDDVPRELQLIFNRLLEYIKTDRYQSAEEVRNELLNIREECTNISGSLLTPRISGKTPPDKIPEDDENSTIIGNDRGWADEETIIEGNG